MIKSKSKAFEHPLSTVFVDLESQCFNIYLPWIILRTMLLVLSLTGLILWENYLLTIPCYTIGENLTNNASLMPQKEDGAQKLFWTQINMGLNNMYPCEQGARWSYTKLSFYSLFGIVCFSFLLIATRELSEACYSFKRYTKSAANILQVSFIICVMTYFVGTFFFEVDSMKHVAAWSVFFAWTEVMIMLSRIPRIGMFIIMFFNVSKRLLGYLTLFFPLGIAFGMAFYVLPQVEDSPFHGIFASFLKVFVMMAGEIGFDDFFEWNKTTKSHSQGSTQIFILLFIILFLIVLLNLLVGLAVSEIQKERKIATKLHNRIAVEEIDSHWQSLHKNMYLKAMCKLYSCCYTLKDTTRKPTYFEKLIGPAGVFKLLKKEWLRLSKANSELSDVDFKWKVCIDPNKGLYDKEHDNNTWIRNDGYEVYFFDRRRNKRFEIKNQGKKSCDTKLYHETGFFLSRKMVSETIKWIKENKNCGTSEIIVVSENLKALMESSKEQSENLKGLSGPRNRGLEDNSSSSYIHDYLKKHGELMDEIDEEYKTFIKEGE
jgi:hypothetical protein